MMFVELFEMLHFKLSSFKKKRKDLYLCLLHFSRKAHEKNHGNNFIDMPMHEWQEWWYVCGLTEEMAIISWNVDQIFPLHQIEAMPRYRTNTEISTHLIFLCIKLSSDLNTNTNEGAKARFQVVAANFNPLDTTNVVWVCKGKYIATI